MQYGFIGCGNMGGALATALSRATKDILLCDPGKGKMMADKLECSSGDVTAVAGNCKRIFIGVKPNMVREALSPIQEILKEKKPLLISMAAGLTLETIEKYAGSPLPIIRIMPNTPVAVGKGMISYTCNSLVTDQDLNSFLDDMRYAGVWERIDEDLMDTASALSGSGPAYMYYFAEALCKGAVECGMDADQALRFAIATMEGAAEMLRTDGRSAEQLRIAVCSPGGSTLAGLKALDEGAFTDDVVSCLKAAYQRNKELAKQ